MGQFSIRNAILALTPSGDGSRKNIECAKHYFNGKELGALLDSLHSIAR
jgi:hypothetical protein